MNVATQPSETPNETGEVGGPALTALSASSSDGPLSNEMEQGILVAAASAVADIADELALLEAVADSLRPTIPNAIVMYGNIEGDTIAFRSPDRPEERALAIGPFARRLIEDGELVMLELAPASGTPIGADLIESGIQSFVAAVATIGGAPRGILLVGSMGVPYPFNEGHCLLARKIGQIVGPALTYGRAAERALIEAEDQHLLAEVAGAAAREAHPRDLVAALQAPIGRIVPLAAVDYFAVEDGVVVPPPDGSTTIVDRPYRRLAISEGQSVITSLESEMSKGARETLISLGAHGAILTAARSGGEVHGLLAVALRQPGYEPDERALRLLRLFAQIVGPAMTNARAAAQARREAEEQRLLAEITKAVARVTDPLALMEEVRQSLERVIPDPLAIYAHLDGENLAFRSPLHPELRTMPFGRYFPNVQLILERGQIVLPHLAAEASTPLLQMFLEAGVRSLVATAAMLGGEARGIFVVGCKRGPYEFSVRQCELFDKIAHIVGPALANARAAERATLDAEEQRLLAQIAAAAARATDALGFIAASLPAFGRIIPQPIISMGYILGDQVEYLDPAGGHFLMPLAVYGETWIEQGQIVFGEPPETLPPFQRTFLMDLGIHAFSGTVATAAGVPTGILFAASLEPGYTFGERELRLLRLCAQIVGPAMTNARTAAQSRREAEEQILIAEIAATAALATTAVGLVEAIGPLFSRLIPQPYIAVGRILGDAVDYVGSSGVRKPVPLGEHGQLAFGDGQIAFTEPPVSGADVSSALLKSAGVHAFSVTVAMSGGNPTDILIAGSREPGYVFGTNELRILQLAAQIIGPAMMALRATAHTAEQEALSRLILESLSESVVLIDENLRAVYANARGQAIVDTLSPIWGGKAPEERIALLDPTVGRALVRAAVDHESARGRTHFPFANGPRWLDFEMIPLDHPQYRLLLVATDVSNEVGLEEERERNRERIELAARLAALGELIAGVAHELNNPLTAILGFAELLTAEATDTKAAEEIGIIHQEAVRARNIVRDLLFIARPSPVERSEVSLNAVVGHIERLRRRAWSAASIDVTVDATLEATVWGNEHQITQVLLNLITNAEHALADCEERKVRIWADQCGDETHFIVSDSGHGMDDATRTRIFEPFFTTKAGTHGTGLGLSLSHSIVAAHGGRIEVESKVGEGTTFRVVLPASNPDRGIGTAAAERDAAPSARVLVVDDEPNVRQVCKRLVERMGFSCEVADTSAAALARVASEQFDLVLCDYRLRGETADAVLAGFARVAPDLIARTVIATGATNDTGVAALVERYGLRLIAKPYGSEEILAELGVVGVQGSVI